MINTNLSLKIISFILVFFISSCATIKAPDNYHYSEIQNNGFNIASWSKISSPSAVYKVYIEGDGHAFNTHGLPTPDPTPKGEMMRELAYGDPSPNVIYLARPCQYSKGPACQKKYWTTARFAPEIINAEYAAIEQIARDHPVILIGFSGGGQIAGLLAVTTDLNIQKIITIAGNLDHPSWTQHHHLHPLNQSLNLVDYQDSFSKINQLHYVGSDDRVIPQKITRNFINNNNLIVEIKGASHSDGWQKIYQSVWNEK